MEQFVHSLTSVIVHDVRDTQHVPLCPQPLHQSPHILPAVTLSRGTELRIKAELVRQGVARPGLPQSLQRREVDHVVSWEHAHEVYKGKKEGKNYIFFSK